jgi:hypothetical protein
MPLADVLLFAAVLLWTLDASLNGDGAVPPSSATC